MIIIRNEKPDEYRETENVIREAFWNHYTPGCNDHYLIHIMRDCPAFIPELDLVAVDGTRIVGSVMSLKSYIKGDDRSVFDVVSLGPIGVLPDSQKKGIGGKMIARSKEIAKQLGYRAVLLCGDPDYYTRQGFVAAQVYDIRNSENMYADALHVCELYEDALPGVSGRYYEDEIYDVDAEEAERFDKSFPPKEIVKGTPAQYKYESMVHRVKAPC
ncbi:MAG: N-acetyltransferase [Lachnospiraceae bacterium]|nr:N-acetyltransferase [Lachnospiraceae bacterium]